MIARVRTAFARHKKLIVAATIIGVIYCAAIELWLPRVDPIPPVPPEMVVALSAGVEDDGELSGTGRERLRLAIEVARKTGATLVTTRVRNDGHPELTSDDAQRRLVNSAGMTKRWMVLDGLALNTRDEAERLRKVMAPMPIVVVTSRLHTRRACAVFERLGYTVTCVSSGLDGRWWKIPYGVAYESAAWVKYKSKGWI